jgi:hypothetical protein
MPRNGQEFPKTLAAGIAYRDAEDKVAEYAWVLGDALLEECGHPGASGVRTGSDSKLSRAAKLLKQNNVDYSFAHLRNLRHVANDFAAEDRSSAVSWTVHRVAGDPETLRAIQEDARKNRGKLTVAYVKKFLKREQHERQKRAEQERRKDSKGPRSDPERESATLKLLENAAQARELGIDALKAVKKYPELKLEEVAAIFNNIEVWSKILDDHPRSDVLQAAE